MMVVKDFKVLGSGDEEVKQDLYYLSFQCWLSLHRVSGSKIPSPRLSQNASKSKTRPLKSGVETKTSLEYNNKGKGKSTLRHHVLLLYADDRAFHQVQLQFSCWAECCTESS